MASHGLASWLSGRLSACSAPTASDRRQQECEHAATLRSSAHLPLDIGFAQLCARETTPPMSVETRALVEEIDSEADDVEFDERAHWSRRSWRKRARAPRRGAGARVDASQPSIARFCMPPTAVCDAIATEEGEAVDGDDAVAAVCGAAAEVVETGEEEEEEKKKDEEVKRGSNERSGKTRAERVGVEAVAGVDRCMMEEGVSTARMSSGRPKRQAVVRAEIVQQQQKLLDAVAARNEAASFLTPPPSTKKKVEEGNATTSGRKRKLEMNRKLKTLACGKGDSTTSSPSVAKTAQSFFLSEQEKKQLQEIETVSLFRAQLRQTREKDLAFFAGKTASPFFQARACIKPSGSSVEDDDGAVEMQGDGETKQRQSTNGGGRWGKPFPLFPEVQHVLIACVEAGDVDRTVIGVSPPKRVVPAVDKPSAVIVADDDGARGSKLTDGVMDQLKAAMNGQVATESSFCEQFWFREHLDASSLPAQVVECIDVTSPRPAENADAAMAELMKRETLLIDELVETHGMREKRVRELLEGLELARTRRLDREQNLSLVDRYLPVNASGLVGNCEALHTLSSWLSAWKVGGGDREKLNCLESELFSFEDGDSDSDDEVGDLCRLFILEGESGAGKSAAVYACAEELGYEIIEINAAQNRSGKSVVELAGEATQSARVLHVGAKAGMKKTKHKKKRRRHSTSRKSLEQPTAASLSLVMFEDADLIFDEDKGFLSAVCSIAKHAKCPIVVTCTQLPDAFPAKPGRLCRELRKPSMDEFATWMRLVAFIEGLQLAPSLIDALGNFFKRDVRRSLHFLEANLPVSDASKKTQWRWQGVVDKKDTSHVDVPAWTLWTTGGSSFDALTSNLLAELAEASSGSERQSLGGKSRKEKQVDVDAMAELAQIMDAVSVAEVWMAPALATGHDGDDDDTEDSFFHRERRHLAALELRRSSLQTLGSSASSLGASLMQHEGLVASTCVQRTLDSALAASRRHYHQTELAALKMKFELPLAYKGCGTSEPRFTLDYMPMVGCLLSSTGLQEGRRRASRRNHYLGDVLGDMSLIDDLPAFNTYLQTDTDPIVAASPAALPQK
ncbi:unnamed protein product [Hyaloperonospora brassicae]|uniref:ATPase AAA-type core domain-containing protein n=1 Tax=Hyaloperonospora brassicae TaxID=162125 RepID=A0AAV0TQR1_HYABA|nr:unnamed protein product [Hyaloperonospora brassicae]